jgi:hypothetical protein
MTRRKLMKEWQVYIVKYADDYQEVRIVPSKDVASPEGLQEFESDLREKATWFYPIGKVSSRPSKLGDSLEIASMKALVVAWEAAGAPKIHGRGAGPSPFESLEKDDDDSKTRR